MPMYRDIFDFHAKFGLTYIGGPRNLPEEIKDFRIKFLEEELNEYKKSVEDCDLEGQLDALVDLVYVALGTAHLQGFKFNEAWKRVHEANMRKVRATSEEQSKRNSSSDVIKPAGWEPPVLKDLVV